MAAPAPPVTSATRPTNSSFFGIRPPRSGRRRYPPTDRNEPGRSGSRTQEPATADVDDLAGDVARLLGHQEGHDGGDLVRAPVAAQGGRFHLAAKATAVGLG